MTSLLDDTTPRLFERNQVLQEARTWVGTPFKHQARVKGVGCDCAQLIIAVGLACGLAEVSNEAFKRFAGYGKLPNPKRMGDALRTFSTEIPEQDALPGDFMWIEWRDEMPMHLAILSQHQDRLMMIHAYLPYKRVVEHGFILDYPAKVVSWWRYPGLV